MSNRTMHTEYATQSLGGHSEHTPKEGSVMVKSRRETLKAIGLGACKTNE